MSNPKRKVTDLLPTEAILISSDAERDAVLKLMDEAGMKWNSGERANYAFIRNQFPYALAYKFNGNDGFPNKGIRIVDFDYDGDVTFYPATDFISTESDEVEVSDTVLLSEVRNKLTPIKNLIAMLESGFIAPSGSQELIYKELKQCKINIEELTRNTPNQ